MHYTKITVGGFPLGIAETGGSGSALVFLHYFGGSSRTWKPVMEALTPNFHSVAPDLPGWGDSDASETGYAVSGMANAVAALVAALGLARYTLVGHSMGGKAAQALAARCPPGLERLLLVAPSPLSPEPMTEDARAEMRAAWGREDTARATLQTIATLPLTEDVQEGILADNLRASRAAWEAWADTGSREDLSALASQINVPTRVLAGALDPVLPPDVLRREVIGRIAGATLTVVPGAGHLLPLENPKAVAAWIQGETASS